MLEVLQLKMKNGQFVVFGNWNDVGKKKTNGKEIYPKFFKRNPISKLPQDK